MLAGRTRNKLARTATTFFSLLPFATQSFFFVSSSSSLHNSSKSCAKNMLPLEVSQFQCLGDNFGYLIHSSETGETAAVDTPHAGQIRAQLDAKGWKLTHILNTHHHWDHTGGNSDLKSSSTKVMGPAGEQSKIPEIDEAVDGGDSFVFGGKKVEILNVGGHTKGHIAYYFVDDKMVFVGDSLFALGCGKMFEGTAEQFWDSLQRLRDLPDDTTVYCAHEYTLSNAKFAVSVEPGNAELIQRFEEIKTKRANNQFTVPTLMGLEKRTNPFLRGDISPEIREKVGAAHDDSPADIFGKIRKAKDNF